MTFLNKCKCKIKSKNHDFAWKKLYDILIFEVKDYDQ